MYTGVDVQMAPSLAALDRGAALREALDFDSFFVAEYPRLLRLAWALTGRRDVAEEHVQEAFLSAHRQWQRVSTLDQPGAWIRRVVANRCVSAARRRTTEARLLARLRSRSVQEVELPEPADELWARVRRLPKRQAQVIALVYVEDLAAAEVAAVLQCSEATVRTHLRRARTALASALGVDDDKEEGEAHDGPR